MTTNSKSSMRDQVRLHSDRNRRPRQVGLYEPLDEHDACGIGFVANVNAKTSRAVLDNAFRMLCNMSHRGGVGQEKDTGDGAGILLGMPHEFLDEVTKNDLGIRLPEPGRFGTGLIFLPKNTEQRAFCKSVFESVVRERGQSFLGWRKVPVDPDVANLGTTAKTTQPQIEQVFIAANENLDPDLFERELFVIRKLCMFQLLNQHGVTREEFYTCSLSARTIVYKGMLTPRQLQPFYLDFAEDSFESHFAIVHSRFSTNTFPSWDRAQPNRVIAHNGEINTLPGNRNWLKARQSQMKSDLFGNDLSQLTPVIEPDCSDSGAFDNMLEFLVQAGRTLPEAVLMMIPEAWQNHATMPKELRDFYKFHSTLQEPWDGPASIAFTDGRYLGAVLDRNGLRPSRYLVTNDGMIVMASETGTVDVNPADVKFRGRLRPGQLFLIDFLKKRIIDDSEIKKTAAQSRPYGEWLHRQRVCLSDLDRTSSPPRLDRQSLFQNLKTFNYTTETLKFMLVPLVLHGKDPLGSMGDDSALACLSDQPKLIYDYFRQIFAQVTNPAIDSLREEAMMSLECSIGPEGNLLDTQESQSHRLSIPQPILDNNELQAIKNLDAHGWRTQTIDITFPISTKPNRLIAVLDNLCEQVDAAIDAGHQFIVLSDRNTSKDRIPLSVLLACGAVHHHLVNNGNRTRVGLVVETGEAREVHHHCLLLGYGADAINPYLAYEVLFQARDEGMLEPEWSDEKIVESYQKGTSRGLLKVMAKMGISTLHSYKGAQVFEALGVSDEVIGKCFAGTRSRIGGVDFEILEEEARLRHENSLDEFGNTSLVCLDNTGQYHWRKTGEYHSWDPQTIAELQNASRNDNSTAFRRFTERVDKLSKRVNLRGQLKFQKRKLIPIESVETAAEIVKRFCTGAMSYGSISAEAHESLAIAMNRLGGKSNTGEGGENYRRFHSAADGDSKRSAIKQVASGRFGVTNWYLTNADELQIKISQGAKPGEGGELPGFKVDATIAATRHSTPGVGLISPPPHHDIYSIEDLSQLIFDLRNVNPTAKISVKLVSEVGVGTIAAGVAKCGADGILIAGASGGTGASPLTSIKHAGLPWELGLAETHQTLTLNGLRNRVRLQTDGQLKTGRDVMIACLLGAEEFGFATAPLITLGCIMMRKCHLNTCPVGIATQNPELRKKFSGEPEHVVNYLFMVAEECREIMAQLGFETLDSLVGRSDLLEQDDDPSNSEKRKRLDLSKILVPVKSHAENIANPLTQADDPLATVLDRRLIEMAQGSIENKTPIVIDHPIKNTDRTVGTLLSHFVSRTHGPQGLPDDTIQINLNGTAGQSLGAWLVKGITLSVAGDANDYVGKGLSGGRIVVTPSAHAKFDPQQNVIVGNVVLYGAVEGEAFFRGIAGERFCVRNSGVNAVVEGVGDHACEYMTGGRVVILGETGRNFAAGMSGGIAYVFDPQNRLSQNCNLDTVELFGVRTKPFIGELHSLIKNHLRWTGSVTAQRILEDWSSELGQFKMVVPEDYKNVLKERGVFVEPDVEIPSDNISTSEVDLQVVSNLQLAGREHSTR